MSLRRLSAGVLMVAAVLAAQSPPAHGDVRPEDVQVDSRTVEDSVRVTLLRVGGREALGSVSSGPAATTGCKWTSRPAVRTGLVTEVELPVNGGPESGLVLYDVFCNGRYHSSVWVGPEDIVDVDAVVQGEVERYVREVLAPVVRIGVNPSGQGLVGLASWFWIEGFSGSVTAPPISAFGMSVDVRMSSGTVRWDFGDGTVEMGDLGRAYPEESSVQHRFQRHGTYDVSAAIVLVPEYSVNGGPWVTLPNLSVTAAASHGVEQRQPVLTNR